MIQCLNDHSKGKSLFFSDLRNKSSTKIPIILKSSWIIKWLMIKSHVDNLLKNKGLLGRKSAWKMLFRMRICFSEKGNTCTLFWNFNFFVIIGKKVLANADSKMLCLEQTFFKIVLEAFCKVTKNWTCSIAVLEIKNKSCSEGLECIEFLQYFSLVPTFGFELSSWESFLM